MIDSNRKEDLSESYMEAISAINGVAMTRNRRDENGIDVFLTCDVIRKDGIEIGVTVEFQLKSTSIYLSVLVAVCTERIATRHQFVVVGQLKDFQQRVVHILLHALIETYQPISLVSENTYQ